jgi:hypothetical protein
MPVLLYNTSAEYWCSILVCIPVECFEGREASRAVPYVQINIGKAF